MGYKVARILMCLAIVLTPISCCSDEALDINSIDDLVLTDLLSLAADRTPHEQHTIELVSMRGWLSEQGCMSVFEMVLRTIDTSFEIYLNPRTNQYSITERPFSSDRPINYVPAHDTLSSIEQAGGLKAILNLIGADYPTSISLLLRSAPVSKTRNTSIYAIIDGSLVPVEQGRINNGAILDIWPLHSQQYWQVILWGWEES